MSLHTIRAFKIGDQRYRHAMCYDSDAVYLQRYTDNEDATCESDLWDSLLCYDHNAVARTPDMKKVGDFRCEGAPNQWVFYEGPNRTRITFPPQKGAESLLDTEVLYSLMWLQKQLDKAAVTTAEVAPQ